jgi:hypothetical protein
MLLSKKAERVKAKIEEKVKGVWISAHDEKGHHYRMNTTDILVDSVTTQLSLLAKPHLIPWACKMAVEFFASHIEDYQTFNDEESRGRLMRDAQFAYTGIRDDAGNIGTQVHNIIEEYVNKWIEFEEPIPDIKALIPDDADGRVFAGARSGELFFKANKYIPIASELLVGSAKVGSAGTLDMLVVDEAGKLVLLDWKSSNLYQEDSYTLQVAAYSKFFEEMSGLKISKAIIVMLSKDYAKTKEYELLDIKEAYKMFKNLVSIYKWKQTEGNKSTDNKKRITI